MALLFLACVPVAVSPQSDRKFRGARFIGWTSLSGFDMREGGKTGEWVATSPEIKPQITWKELVVSWNADLPAAAAMKVEARAIYSDRSTPYYSMGLWSGDPTLNPRESVNKQKDADAEVQTDTLVLKSPALRAQVRITISGAAFEVIKLVGLSFAEAGSSQPPLNPNKTPWGRILDVPELSQLRYEGGRGWCSPTATCMVINHWARRNPSLERTVPEVAAGVNDPNWPGTGNWAFNTAYAGSLPGIRAFVTRFSDLSEVEDWIAAGVPVVMSVLPRLLTGSDSASNGHLIVGIGFTKDGDLVANDPWARLEKGQPVRRIYKRANAAKAWAASHNTVYLIYPDSLRTPRDRFGHWELRNSVR